MNKIVQVLVGAVCVVILTLVGLYFYGLHIIEGQHIYKGLFSGSL